MNSQDSLFCGNCGTSLTRPAPEPGLRDSQPQSTILADSGPPPYQYAPGPAADQYAADAQADYYGPGRTGHQHAPLAKPPSQPFRLELRRLSRVDQTVGGASLIVLISLFLPWFGVSVLGESFSLSGTTAHGYLVIVVIVAVLMIAYLLLRSGWDELPVNLPVAHAPLLLIGTGLQLLLVLIGFFDVPVAGLNWEIGAYLALLASAAAAVPLVVPAIRSWQDSR